MINPYDLSDVARGMRLSPRAKRLATLEHEIIVARQRIEKLEKEVYELNETVGELLNNGDW